MVEASDFEDTKLAFVYRRAIGDEGKDDFQFAGKGGSKIVYPTIAAAIKHEPAKLTWDQALSWAQLVGGELMCSKPRKRSRTWVFWCEKTMEPVKIAELSCDDKFNAFELTIFNLCKHAHCAQYEDRRVGRANMGINIFDISQQLNDLRDGVLFDYTGNHSLAAVLYRDFQGTGLIEAGRMNLLRNAGRHEKQKREDRAKARKSTTFDELIERTWGFTRIFVNPDEDPDEGCLVLQGKRVECVVFVHPVAPSALANCSAVALDASFKALRPAGCYFVPQAIIMNSAVPIGLIIAPSEASRALQYFKQAVDDASAQWETSRRLDYNPHSRRHGRGCRSPSAG
jgi:hypothetical protein